MQAIIFSRVSWTPVKTHDAFPTSWFRQTQFGSFLRQVSGGDN